MQSTSSTTRKERKSQPHMYTTLMLPKETDSYTFPSTVYYHELIFKGRNLDKVIVIARNAVLSSPMTCLSVKL